MYRKEKRNFLRRALLSGALLSLSALMAAGVSASETAAAREALTVRAELPTAPVKETLPPGGVVVFLNGEAFARESCVVSDGVTRVPFASFCEAVTGGEAAVTWDEASSTASAEWRGMTVTAKAGTPYIVANGRYLYGGYESYVENGVLMTAIRPAAKAFSLDVEWVDENMRVNVAGEAAPIASGDEFYDGDVLFWLSRIISAEARGEPLLGKLAVGAVVYNRVDSRMYPNTVYGVIFDMKHGVQFTPAYSGSVYREPTAESVVAAKICMEGFRLRDDILFFCAKSIKDTCWAGRNRPYVMTIANASFFA